MLVVLRVGFLFFFDVGVVGLFVGFFLDGVFVGEVLVFDEVVEFIIDGVVGGVGWICGYGF